MNLQYLIEYNIIRILIEYNIIRYSLRLWPPVGWLWLPRLSCQPQQKEVRAITMGHVLSTRKI